VVLIDGVVNVADPDCNNVPPPAALYQSIVSPAPAVAEMLTLPVPQREAAPAVGADGSGVTVTVTGDEVTTHPFDAVTRTE
jgi:hypothetical protein